MHLVRSITKRSPQWSWVATEWWMYFGCAFVFQGAFVMLTVRCLYQAIICVFLPSQYPGILWARNRKLNCCGLMSWHWVNHMPESKWQLMKQIQFFNPGLGIDWLMLLGLELSSLSILSQSHFGYVWTIKKNHNACLGYTRSMWVLTFALSD